MRIFTGSGIVALIMSVGSLLCVGCGSEPNDQPITARNVQEVQRPSLGPKLTPLPKLTARAKSSWQSRTLFTFGGNPFICVAYSPDSSLIVAGAANRDQPAASDFKIGTVNKGALTQQMQVPGSKAADVGFAPDGRSIVGAYALFGKPQGHVADVWDVRRGHLVRSLKARLATGYRALFTVNRAKGLRSLIRVGALPWPETRPQWVQVVLSDGLTGRPVRSLRLPTGGATPATFCLSRDGKVLAIAYLVPVGPDSAHQYNRMAKVYDAASGRLLLELAVDKQRESGLAISPDSRILASGRYDGSVQLWDIPKRKLLRTLGPSPAGVENVAFSPDGKLLAKAGWFNPTVSLWQTASGQLQGTLHGHKADITSLAFAPNGATLASGSGDGTVKLWRMR